MSNRKDVKEKKINDVFVRHRSIKGDSMCQDLINYSMLNFIQRHWPELKNVICLFEELARIENLRKSAYNFEPS